MTRNRRTAALTAAAVAILLGLGGCMGGSPAATSTPGTSPSPAESTPSASETPEDPLAQVTSVVLRPEVLELRAGSELVVAIPYSGHESELVDALTRVSGVAPVVEDATPRESPPGTAYTWDAILYYDTAAAAEDENNPMVMPAWVRVTAPAFSSGVTLTTEQGYQVGDDVAAAIALGNPSMNGAGYGYYGAVEYGPVRGEHPYPASGVPFADAVVVDSGADGEAIEYLQAPLVLGLGGA
ncbi:hypothetical protein [Agromyces laixinhei]|uniref:hypothetical protein n=1 Tax=Agromyces laixinhei TaxID=2585717 RepID=UPI0012ED9E25|nr:hypothetical protein [Agromyces laixinhei]